MLNLDQLRQLNPIETLVGEHFDLRQSGAHFIGIEHDSLVVNPSSGWYHWNSRDERGDVIDFVGRHILGLGTRWDCYDRQQFVEALHYLAERAGMPLETTQPDETWLAERDLIRRLQQALLTTPQALAYATQTRGWQTTTIDQEHVGFMPNNKRALLKGLNLSEHWVAIINRFPANMLVYIHQAQGRLVYLSGRSIEGKRHYNPPRELVGERQAYANACYRPNTDEVVIVEGQADAITFGQWGQPAIALAGMHLNENLLEKLKQHRRVFVALDNTSEAQTKALAIARQIGDKACLPIWPAAIKDANEWLVKQQATAKQVQLVLNNARTLLEAEVKAIEYLGGLKRQDAIDALLQQAVNLEKNEQVRLKALMKDQLGVTCTYFNDMLKVHTKNRSTDQTDHPTILEEDVPLLSPALGFTEELGLVTVSIMERTANKRLNIQPYLVTSQRELRRLEDEQIITLGGHDAALRVIPEGTEFLMRWRYKDIQRFLEGEEVNPRAVFEAVHRLYTTYVDFNAGVDSQLVTLWVIGTYFYTLFRAYPYLALNGPKNSGKSTVLNVTRPLAFNMVTTSDMTGPSLFRLIHYNSCTVGIDEVERYHHPRDPETQQIRQLLNSGYKPGMPAIRLTGDDFKPQAFDVYSPKMLANIMGLEDILASRCIALPMRRTTRQMPTLPTTFDGASIRHQLYSLALTCYPQIAHNYTDRPDLHTLTNRSAELWSPLIALAAFFEEMGDIEGLVRAVQEAAQSDVSLSEGKALSQREEAVLQSLDILTRQEAATVWVKASDLRSQVRQLLGLSEEQMGNAQWVGHILKRLQLTDRRRRKAYTGGQMYLMEREQVLEMMNRYDVDVIG